MFTGVSYLAAGVIEHFKENQPELHITQDEIDSVKIAGYGKVEDGDLKKTMIFTYLILPQSMS